MIAHFDCHSGASGDMILAALIDAGADIDAVRKQLERLDLGDFRISVREVSRAGIIAARLEIEAPKRGAASHRDLHQRVEGSSCDPEVRRLSLRILDRLAVAESRVHGIAPGEVHYHDLDECDTLIDVVGTAAALFNLGVDRASASAIATGSGTVETGHGRLPVPPPAVVELLASTGAVLYSGDVEGELLTPTGAAILAEIVGSFGPMPPIALGSVGYGAGARDFEVPNVLRVLVGGEDSAGLLLQEVVLVEANIDDMNPEIYEYVRELLFQAGAEDVWLQPVIGKGGRPANVLSVLAPPGALASVRQVVLEETSTLGLRSSPATRWVLSREWVETEVEGFRVRVKVGKRGDRVVNVSPEYSDCVAAARATGLPLKEVFRRAASAADGVLGGLDLG